MKKLLSILFCLIIALTPTLFVGCKAMDKALDITNLELKIKNLEEQLDNIQTEKDNLTKENEELKTEITTLKFLNKFPKGVINEDCTITNVSITVEDEGDAIQITDKSNVVIENGYFNGGQTPFGGVGNTAIWVKSSEAKLTINNGYFKINGLAKDEEGNLDEGHIDLIYVLQGEVEINGGLFEGSDNTVWLLNCKDEFYQDGTAKIVVKGGEFINWNPADCVSEGEHTSFVAEGYKVEVNVIDESTTIYKVVKDEVVVPPVEEKVTITFYNGEIKVLEKELDKNSILNLLAYPELKLVKEGYAFKGWSLTVDGEVVEFNSGIVIVDKNISYYAIFELDQVSPEEKEFTLKFYKDEVEILSKTLKENESFNIEECAELKSATPKEGFRFKGWSLTKNGDLIDSKTITVTEDKSFYAIYEKIPTYIYIFNSGSKIVAALELEEGSLISTDKLKEINNKAKKEGYTLKGWATEENGAILFLDSFTAPVNSNTKLYAIYEEVQPEPTPEKVKLIFKDGETELISLEVEKDKSIHLYEHPEVKEAAKKAGYNFKGWALTPEGEVFILEDILPGILQNTVLYAIYEKIEEDPSKIYYNYYFYDEDKTTLLYTQRVEDSKSIALRDYPDINKAAPKKEGYIFKGWAVEGLNDPDGKPHCFIQDYLPNALSNINFFAVYEKIEGEVETPASTEETPTEEQQ